MQSGELDTLFDVYERTDKKNGAGQIKQEWQVIGSFYGAVKPVSIDAFVQSGKQGSGLVARVVMRPNDFPSISASHFIRDVDTLQTYKVDGVLPVNKSKKTLMCSEGKLNGI